MNTNLNPQIRSRATAVTKDSLGRLILMTLALLGATIGLMLAYGLLIGITMNIHEAVGALIAVVGAFAVFFFVIGLSLGYTNGLIRIAEGQRPPVSIIFSRFSKGLPGLGLSLWIGLKVWLWMLPGLGVAMVGAVLGSLMDSEELLVFASSIGIILAYVLMIVAAFRYAMSTYYFADNPDNGVFGSVEKSKRTMEGRKWQLFRLCIPYVLILLAIMLGVGIVSALLMNLEEIGVILALILSLGVTIVSIYISILVSMAQVCFYTMHRI